MSRHCFPGDRAVPLFDAGFHSAGGASDTLGVIVNKSQKAVGEERALTADAAEMVHLKPARQFDETCQRRGRDQRQPHDPGPGHAARRHHSS